MKINYKSIRKSSDNKINLFILCEPKRIVIHSLDGEAASGQDVRCKIEILDRIPAPLPCEVLA